MGDLDQRHLSKVKVPMEYLLIHLLLAIVGLSLIYSVEDRDAELH